MSVTPMRRVNMNVPESVCKRVDEYALKMSVTKTVAWTILVGQALDQLETVQNFNKYMNVLGKEKEDFPKE